MLIKQTSNAKAIEENRVRVPVQHFHPCLSNNEKISYDCLGIYKPSSRQECWLSMIIGIMKNICMCLY